MSSHQALKASPQTPEMGRFWTIPNVLTLIRIALVFPVFYLILVDGPLMLILALIVVGMATDWFDGRLARWYNSVSDWGKILDPLADKVGTSLLVFALFARGFLPLWFLMLLIIRDALILFGGIYVTRRTGQILMSMWMGKVAVTAVAITILAALLRADPEVLQVCVVVSAILLVYSFLQYIVRGVQMLWTDRKNRVRRSDLEGERSKGAPSEISEPRMQ